MCTDIKMGLEELLEGFNGLELPCTRGWIIDQAMRHC
jgi:hypothetical protein